MRSGVTRKRSFLPEIEELASTNVKGYQLCLWFAMYQERRGAIEARMLRDAFFNVFDLLSEGEDSLGKQVRWILGFQDKAIAYVDEIPPEKKTALEEGLGTQMPPEYYIALYQLLGFPESPYAPDKEELPEAQQRALCVCLLNGRITAHEFFSPMLDAIQTFDPAKIPHWEWSKTLGAYERHLQRRHGNPLFTPERQTVTAADVYQARVHDAQAHDVALKDLETIRKELREEELPYTWFEYLNDKRERIEAVQDRIGVMDRCGDDLKPLADRLREYVVGIIQDTVKEDPKRAQLIAEAEELVAQRRAFSSTDWVRQIRHPENVIPPEEVASALLTESPDTVTQIVLGLESDAKLRTALIHIRTGSLDVVRRASAAGQATPEMVEKLQILGVAL